MSKEEVEAVLAHEVSHVANGDMVTLTLIQGVVNTFVIFLSRIVGYLVDSFLRRGDSQSSGPGIGYTITVIVCDILFGILASIIVAWFSRQREFRADAGAAGLMGSPRPMIAPCSASAAWRSSRCRRASPVPASPAARLHGAVLQPPEHGRAHRRAVGAGPVSFRGPRFGTQRLPQSRGPFCFVPPLRRPGPPAPAWSASNLLWLALILMSARLFAPLAQKLGFPAVLGELLLGVAARQPGAVGLQRLRVHQKIRRSSPSSPSSASSCCCCRSAWRRGWPT
jgi:hypothetical protein